MTPKSLLAIAALMLFTGCATTDDWTRTDTLLEVAFQVSNAADAYTTSRIQHRADIHEGNAITARFIGEQPSDGDTAVYFATLGISHWLISRSLPKKWRPWYQAPTAAYSAWLVTSNCQLGLCK